MTLITLLCAATGLHADEQTAPTIVVAEKRPAEAQNVAMSLTVLDQLALQDAGAFSIKDAADYAPNTHFSEFTARKLSFPFVRGVGSGPTNPSVTTYVDGVPQLHANSSSFELLGIDHVEFLRGPQGSLYGRNTIGGVINIFSQRPRTDRWTFDAQGSFGNYDMQDYRFFATGPVGDQLAIGLGGGRSLRDGYTQNTVTGNNLDARDASFGRVNVLFTPTDNTEIRLNLYGESARDGDFALGDLASLRHTDHRVSHDFEGKTQRDLISPSLSITHHNDAVQFTSVTGYVNWDTLDITDLDATSTPLATRTNREKMQQFTQEFRIANLDDAPVALNDNLKMQWLAGVFVFHSEYDQGILNSFSAFFPGGPFNGPSRANLNNTGVGAFAQAMFTFDDKLDLTLGLRYDHEFKSANLYTGATPLNTLQTLDANDDFGQLSPRIALAYHVSDDVMTYASISKGFKAGGFNATAPAGGESYNEETSWTTELGIKSQWLDKKLTVNASLYYIDWQDLQLDQPNPVNPLLFYVANAGAAHSKGAELQVNYKLTPGWDIFGSAGYTDASFNSGSSALIGGVKTNVGGNALPFAPDFTWTAGTQVYHECLKGLTLYARAQVIGTGAYVYDASNAQAQNTYTVADFRLGVRQANWFVEGWVRNAFDEQYVPLALPSSLGAPSGYIGESGAPQTFGLTLGIHF